MDFKKRGKNEDNDITKIMSYGSKCGHYRIARCTPILKGDTRQTYWVADVKDYCEGGGHKDKDGQRWMWWPVEWTWTTKGGYRRYRSKRTAEAACCKYQEANPRRHVT